MPQVPRWYAVYTHPRAEKVVAQHLNLRRIENFLPLYSKLSRWKNGMRMNLELPLFPGYLFVKICLVDRIRVLQTPSVALLVGSATQPLAVPEPEVEIMRAQLSLVAAEPHPFISVGDRVHVRSGPLAGLEGFLIQKKNEYRFVLSINMIMQSIAVEVDACDIEPILNQSCRASLSSGQPLVSYNA